MPYITREDGERFVIPSYRDVLAARQKSQLKKDILLLSQSYGEYITLQKKGPTQYEVAFSSESGYLLGESIWHYFKKPIDLIYCEAIPNTTEALLVIVKSDSVYLDGSFPLDSIPEELIIFLSQQNNFEIYTYGDVPISEHPEPGKFSFEEGSVKSFTVLTQPVFPSLPLINAYQLQLVDPVLKAHGIGIFPTRQLVTGVIVIGLIWMIWLYFTSRPVEIPHLITPTNPYQSYLNALSSPAPEEAVAQILQFINLTNTLPGWSVQKVTYSARQIDVLVLSQGGKMEDLIAWAKNHAITVQIQKDGVHLNTNLSLKNRSQPTKIYDLKEVVAIFIDRLSVVYPGNNLTVEDFIKQDMTTSVGITINLNDVTPLILQLIGDQFKDLPIQLQKMAVEKQANGTYNGSITIEVLGS